jgi:hypothetical protein
MKEEDVAKEIVKRQRNNKNNSKKLSYNIGTRKDKTRSNKGTKEDGRNEGSKETTATNEQEGNKVTRTATIARKRSTEVNRIQVIRVLNKIKYNI